MVDLTPIVTGLSATSGSAGTQVTVIGQNFSGAAGHLQVLFGNTPATSVTVVDDSHVLAVAPAGSGTVDVRVQSGVSDPNDSSNINSPIFGYGVSAVSTADQFSYIGPLIVTAANWTSAGLTLKLGSDGKLHVYITGTTTDAVPPRPPASVTSIQITSPSSTTANLTIDSTAGNPVPAGGLTYSGAAGLIKTGSGSVTLSGPDAYTGGTAVSAGTLLVNAASALPAGTSLKIGAGGVFIFDPSVTASGAATNVSNAKSAQESSDASVTTAAPVARKVVSSIVPFGMISLETTLQAGYNLHFLKPFEEQKKRPAYGSRLSAGLRFIWPAIGANCFALQAKP